MKKLAMIGCGGIGSYHLGHFVNFKDIVELAGFCDLIPEKAQGFVEKAGSGKAYTDYKVMLDEVQPDLVFVCIPPTCHGEIEFELIARGIPFFVEKPVAKDLELAKSIRNAVKEKGLITATGFQCRYSDINDPAIAFVKNHPIVFIDCARIGGVPMVWWWRKRSTSLGQIVEQTIYQFDLIRYIFGEPETVFTFGTKGFVTEVEGYEVITIPSYNVERFLEKCLDSMCGVDERLEVVVVNDGSKDSTSQIAHAYAERYPDQVKVIDKENGGHGSGINAGLDAAEGRYYKVVDADDWITTENLTPILDVLEEIEADAVIMGYKTVNISNDVVLEYLPISNSSGRQIDMIKLDDKFDDVNACLEFHCMCYNTEFL